MKFQAKSSLWMEYWPSLACCPHMSSTSCGGKVRPSLINLQDDDVCSIVIEELTSSKRSKAQQEETVSFMNWRSAWTKSGLESVGSGMSVISASGGDADGGGGEELKRYFMLDQGKLPSSNYKGVVPQPKGQRGEQNYEKQQRVWLGTFNQEEDSARAYDRAAIKFRGRDAISKFRPVAEVHPEERFMRHQSKDEIVDMLRKHTYDEELDQHPNKMKNTAIDSGDRQENEGAPGPSSIQETANAYCYLNNPDHSPCPSREHLFEKAVTPSDVGKLNRLVIPKQHAEKHFPLIVNSSDKLLLLNFEDNTGKAWRFRYSYWNSSQSYVLTKGWSRFVKDKKLEAGDIVSFHRGTPDPHQLYITWRRRPFAMLPVQTKTNVGFPYRALNHFQSAHHVVAYNPQWMHIFWRSSQSSFCHTEAAVWPPQSPAIPLYISTPAKCLNIEMHSGVERPAQKEAPQSFDPSTSKKEVRLFGVNLAESKRIGEITPFPS